MDKYILYESTTAAGSHGEAKIVVLDTEALMRERVDHANRERAIEQAAAMRAAKETNHNDDTKAAALKMFDRLRAKGKPVKTANKQVFNTYGVPAVEAQAVATGPDGSV